jgi:hypothetical protein
VGVIYRAKEWKETNSFLTKIGLYFMFNERRGCTADNKVSLGKKRDERKKRKWGE